MRRRGRVAAATVARQSLKILHTDNGITKKSMDISSALAIGLTVLGIAIGYRAIYAIEAHKVQLVLLSAGFLVMALSEWHRLLTLQIHGVHYTFLLRADVRDLTMIAGCILVFIGNVNILTSNRKKRASSGTSTHRASDDNTTWPPPPTAG